MNTKEKLIKVAGKLFGERGYDGVSIRDIIREAGVNLGAVTYHFGSKEALFMEAIIRKSEPLKEMGQRISESKKSPDEKIRQMMEEFAFYVMHEAPEMKALFAEILSGGDHLPDIVVERVAWRNKIFAGILQDGIDQNVFRECDVECATWTFFGMLSSYILFQPLVAKEGRRKAYSRAFVRRAVDTALEIFMNGICTTESKGRAEEGRKTRGRK